MLRISKLRPKHVRTSDVIQYRPEAGRDTARVNRSKIKLATFGREWVLVRMETYVRCRGCRGHRVKCRGVVDSLLLEFDHVFNFLPFFEHCPTDDPGVLSEERV